MKKKPVEWLRNNHSRIPEMAMENIKNFSGKRARKIRNELPKLSPEMVRYIITTHSALQEKCRKFNSKLDNNKQKKYQKLV